MPAPSITRLNPTQNEALTAAIRAGSLVMLARLGIPTDAGPLDQLLPE